MPAPAINSRGPSSLIAAGRGGAQVRHRRNLPYVRGVFGLPSGLLSSTRSSRGGARFAAAAQQSAIAGRARWRSAAPPSCRNIRRIGLDQDTLL